MKDKLFYTYCDTFELAMSLDTAQCCHHQGACDADVKATIEAGDVERPEAATPEALRSHLAGYGAWDEAELADDATNWERTVWLAAGDITEEWVMHGKEAGPSDDCRNDTEHCQFCESKTCEKCGEYLAESQLADSEPELCEGCA